MKVLQSTLLIFFAITFLSCGNQPQTDLGNNEIKPFVPTNVIVGTKKDVTIDKVFNFINSFDHEVKHITSTIFSSPLAADSLNYIVDFLNTKPYVKEEEGWPVKGYIHYQTGAITITPRFFDMHDRNYQTDWLETMEKFNFSEPKTPTSGYVLLLLVPEGQEKTWVNTFSDHELLEWAELNHIRDIEFGNN